MKGNSKMIDVIPRITVVLIILSIFFCIAKVFLPEEIAYASDHSEIYYAENNYFDDGEGAVATETIEYSTKQSSPAVLLNNTFPAYYNTNNALSNSCANVAGANIIGYYDRYYENLIPDHTPGIARGNHYTYYSMANQLQKKQNIINDLYRRMGTNQPNPGTTQDGYKSGLSSYIYEKNRTVSYASVMTNRNFDLNKLHQAIENGMPVSLYLSGYNISQVHETNGTVTISKYIYTGNHIMVVYGYQTVKYFNHNDVLINTKTYLYVATGMLQTGYYILENNGVINDAESVRIR